MSQYGYIKVDNKSLSDEMFCKVCDRLKLLTNHYYQDLNVFYIYGIDSNKTQYNVDRGAITHQSTCFLDAVSFYTRYFDEDTKNGFIYSYNERKSQCQLNLSRQI
jgi:hypothetical protein